jgi:hypothetical protein
MQRDLIDEAGGVVVHIKKPIANLGKEVPGDLASDCSISLTGNLRADSKAPNIAFRRQVERIIKIISPAYPDKRVEPVFVKRKTLAQPAL